MPLLRFFWEPGIDLFGTVASTFFLHNGDAKFVIAGHETFVVNVEDQEALRDDNPFLKVVHEIILAFQRLVESEMVSLHDVVYKFPILTSNAPCFFLSIIRFMEAETCVQQNGNPLSERLMSVSVPGLCVGAMDPSFRRFVVRPLRFSLK